MPAIRLAVVAILVLLTSSLGLQAQGKTDATTKTNVATKADAAAKASDSSTPFIEDARKYVIQSESDAAKLQLHEQSLFNWTNPIRQQERGAIYVWLHRGRPLVIGSLFTYELSGKVGSWPPLKVIAGFGKRPWTVPMNRMRSEMPPISARFTTVFTRVPSAEQYC